MSQNWSYVDTAELYRVFCQTVVAGWQDKQTFSELVGGDLSRKRNDYYADMELDEEDFSDHEYSFSFEDVDEVDEMLVDDLIALEGGAMM